MGRIVPVRLDEEDLELVTVAAKASHQTISDWIRRTIRQVAEELMIGSYLHDAIKVVLSKRLSKTATTEEIADEIAKKGLYLRKDGKTAKKKQIDARVRKHRDMFTIIAPQTIKLN